MTAEADSPDDSPWERHRALARETDRRFARVYGAGGAGVLAAGALTWAIVPSLDGVAAVLPYVLGLTAMLVSLFVLRVVVNRQRRALRAEVEAYCEVNDLDWKSMRDYYDADGVYSYFVALFTDTRAPRS